MAFAQLPQWHVFDDAGRRKYLTNDERCRFLAEVADLPLSRRALCCVLAFTGCRISEALAITADHIDAERGALTLITLKRRKQAFRTVLIPPEVVDMLLSLARRLRGRFWGVHRTTAWRWIKQVMARAGIVGLMACCRGLRRGFGMRAAICRIPINIIQRWMGHASSVTTAIYIDAAGAEETEFARRLW